MILELIKKHKCFILYGIFGVLTTVVNVCSYWVIAYIFMLSIMTSTIVAWLLAVLFAYITNRKWVFYSKAKGKKEICKELCSFFSCRLITGVVDWLCMFVFVEKLNINDMFIKLIANILVIVLNFLASKLIIFK